MAPPAPPPPPAIDPFDGLAVDIQFADLYPCPPHWHIDPAVVTHTGLFYIWKGQGWLEYNGRRFDAEPGDLFFTRPGVEVAAGHNPDRPVTVLSTALHLSTRAGADPLRHHPLPARLRLPPAARRELLPRFTALIAERHDPAPAAQLAARGYALSLLALALRLATELPAANREGALAGRPADDDRLGRVLDHIDRHLADPLDLAALAKVAHLSPPHFAATFRRATGKPPMAWLLDRRIERARALLAASDRTVEQIARLVGFDDPFHFSRAFRRKTGLPPTAYRAAMKNPFQP